MGMGCDSWSQRREEMRVPGPHHTHRLRWGGGQVSKQKGQDRDPQKV